MKTLTTPFLLTSFCLFVIGCGASGPTDVKSKDGKFQVTVLEGMQPATELNDQADIQAMNGFRELYVVVLTEPKSDFPDEFELKDYAGVAFPPFSQGVSAAPTTPRDIKTDNGDAGIQYDVHGTADGHKIGYLVTFVDTGDHFHQVLAWTLDERYSQHKGTLTKIAASLKPTSAAKPAAPEA